MPKNVRIVQPDGEGDWDVKKPHADRASGNFDHKTDAIDRAREILRNTGGGELQIRDKHGKIIDSDTVPPGNDPNPPRDTK
jgi:hypothetical protein